MSLPGVRQRIIIIACVSGVAACAPSIAEEEAELIGDVSQSATRLVSLSDWVLQDLPNRLLVSDINFPDTADTYCTRLIPSPGGASQHSTRRTMEWIHRQVVQGREEWIEADLFTQLGRPDPNDPWGLIGTVQAFNNGGFAGPGYKRACWGAEPRFSSSRVCDLDSPYGIIPANAGSNHQQATEATYNVAQWGWVIGEPHRSPSANLWPMPAPLEVFPAGYEVFTDTSIGSHTPWRAEAIRKLGTGSTACSWLDEYEGVGVSRHRYVYLVGVPFGTYYTNLVASRGGADSALGGNVDVLVHLTEYQTWSCREHTSQAACTAVPVCAWNGAACVIDNSRMVALENTLNRVTEERLQLTASLGIPQSLHAPHLEMNAYVRGWGRVVGAWGSDPDCDLTKCASNNTEARYECLTRCNATFGFHRGTSLTGYRPSSIYATSQPFTLPYASNFSTNVRRTGYDAATWGVNAGLAYRGIARDCPGICAGSTTTQTSCSAHERRERPAPGPSATWCPF